MKKEITPEKRALTLFMKGKTLLEVEDILLDEFPELTEWQIYIEADAALILHKEKSIPLENKINT